MSATSTLTRRRLVQLLVMGGFVAPELAESLQAREVITPEILARAQKLLDRDLDPARLEAILPALQRNLDFFQIVRDLDIEDSVEPAPIFRARGE